MKKLNKEDVVWISTINGIKESKVISVGSKYITTTYNKRIKFDVNTFKEINGTGYISFIIDDIDTYLKRQELRVKQNKLNKVDFHDVDEEIIDDILRLLKL